MVALAADAGVAITSCAAAAVLVDASAAAARVCVTAAVVRFGSEGGVLLAMGAGAVFGGAILPDTAGASGFGAGSDLRAASTFWAGCGFWATSGFGATCKKA